MNTKFPFETKLLWIMGIEERNAVWLSKKVDCSHTLCYKWLRGGKVSEKYRKKIRSIFGDRYDI